jgi:hypothetical protein
MIYKSTVKASVRHLTRHALDRPGDGDPGETTKTLKFRVDAKGHTRTRLDQIFTAQRQFVRDLLNKLEGMWDKDPERFIQMVNSSASEPFEKKTSCFGWMLTKFLTGSDLPEHLSRQSARAALGPLSGNMKSFVTRRKNVLKDMAVVIGRNRENWESGLNELCAELKIDQFKGPPSVDPDKLSAKTVEKYNEWVAAARVWCNLILAQKHKIPRGDAFFPTRLKAYPGFPGSVIHKEAVPFANAIKELRKVLADLKRTHLKLFDGVTANEWSLVLERFPAPQGDGGKGMRHQMGKTLAVLGRKHPEWKPRQLIEELVSGLERGADSLTKHIENRQFSDRPAAIKLINLLNNACVVLMEPLRVKNLYKEYYEEDTPRRNAFGQARGSLTEPTDQADSLQIEGFSLKKGDAGSCNFDGLLAVTPIEGKDQWSFFFDPKGPGGMGIAELSKHPRGSTTTEYQSFGTSGGSRKKAQASEKKLVRERLWIRRGRTPLQLPVQFGTRQGREYLWNFDHGLKKSSDPWLLTNGRLLRVYPPTRPQYADYFLTITLQKDTPPMAISSGEKLVGVDRGEQNPASFAVVDAKGKLLERGNVGEKYAAKIRQFAEMKSDLQRTAGGYTRKLRAKERNTASALGGLVIRELLDLLVRHPGALVFERLTSGITTRGGRGTLMGNMHYERILSGVEGKLAEAGCYKVPSAAKYRGNKINAFIRFVDPRDTSATCSACGEVFSSGWYKKTAATIAKESPGSWSVTLPSSKKIQLPSSYTSYMRGRGEKTWNTSERMEELFKDRKWPDLPPSTRKTVEGLVARLTHHRPKRGEFVCPSCGHKDDADLQAALNIARKSICLSSLPPRQAKQSEGEDRRSTEELWKDWYKKRIREKWA